MTANNRSHFVILLTLVICLGGTSPALSAVSLKDYERTKTSDSLKEYLYGVGDGYLWANAELESRGLPKLFCMPPKFGLNAENYADILGNYLKETTMPFSPDWPIAAILLEGLQHTFPCK